MPSERDKQERAKVDVRVLSDADVIREYDLKESSVEELRLAVGSTSNLAALLRKKMDEDCLDICRAQWLVWLGFGVGLQYQFLDVWINGYLKDESLDEIIREKISTSPIAGRAWLNK